MRTPIFLLMLILALVSPSQDSQALQDQATPTPTGSPSPVPTITPDRSAEKTSDDIRISSFQSGQALQGNVSIQGTTDVEGFLSAELSFAYANDPTGTWFLIGLTQEPVEDGTLARWDTTTITDGKYDLRLKVVLTNGVELSTIVESVRVRNYTPVETNTPVPTGTPEPSVVHTKTPSLTITGAPRTSTPMPTNPAQLTPSDLTTSLGRGALGTAAAFLLLGLYVTIRRAFRR